MSHRVHAAEMVENGEPIEEKPRTKKGIRPFVRKYFLAGQNVEDDHQLHYGGPSEGVDGDDLPFSERYRKYIGFALPVIFFQVTWWILAFRYNIFRLYPTRYELAVTMLVGSTIAGATSEGGGSVAFPVMTLLLHIDPTVARDFALMCQSCGMTAAAFTILYMRVVVEWHSLVFCSIGASAGIIVGLQYVDHVLSGQEKKMLFVSIWFAFAISLFLLNRQRKRITHLAIPEFGVWKAAVLIFTGIIGGLCSAFAGTGACMCSFIVLTLLFRVTEKVATPTSIVLMTGNTLVGFFWRQLIMSDVSDLAWEYFEVAVPVAVVCAPLGALIASHFHRQVLASLIYIIEITALVGFLVTGPPVHLIVISAAIIFFSFFFFLGLCRLGERLNGKYERECREVVYQTKASAAELTTPPA